MEELVTNKFFYLVCSKHGIPVHWVLLQHRSCLANHVSGLCDAVITAGNK